MKGLGPYWKKSRYKFRWKFDMVDGLSECRPILVPPSNRLITSVFCVLRYPDKTIYILFTCNTLPIPYGIDAVPMCIWLWTRKKSTWIDDYKKNSFIHIPASNLRDLLNIPLIIVERKWNFVVVMALIVFSQKNIFFNVLLAKFTYI